MISSGSSVVSSASFICMASSGCKTTFVGWHQCVHAQSAHSDLSRPANGASDVCELLVMRACFFMLFYYFMLCVYRVYRFIVYCFMVVCVQFSDFACGLPFLVSQKKRSSKIQILVCVCFFLVF